MDLSKEFLAFENGDDLEEEINFENCSSPGPSSIVQSRSNTSVDQTPTPIMVENADSQDFCNDFFKRTGQPHSGLTQIEETAATFSYRNSDGSGYTFLRRQTSFKRTPEATKQAKFDQQRWANDSPLSHRSSAIFTDQLFNVVPMAPQDTQSLGLSVPNQRFENLPPQLGFGFDEAFWTRVNGLIVLTCEKYNDSVSHPRYLFDNKKNTLYVMPGHSVAIYLGQCIPELTGATVRAYVIYDDDATRHKLVTTCPKHTKPETDPWHKYYVKSDDASVIRDRGSPSDPLSITFPSCYNRQAPSISVNFECNNSCLGRRKLRLVVEVELGNMRWSRFILLRVCSNPGRDARTATVDDVTERIKYFKESMPVQKRSTVMKKSYLRAKRTLTQDLREAPPEEDTNDTTKVYTVYVCGKDNYYQVLRQAQLLSVEERHYCSTKRTSGLRSTQIEELTPVADWLGLMDKAYLSPNFTINNINLMRDLLGRYTPTLFQSIDIPKPDIVTLNINFVNWMNVTLCNYI